MKLFIANNKSSGDKKAFEIIKNQVIKKPGSLIGLAAGKTINGLYKLISKDVTKNPKVWSRLKVFQIDENLGIPPTSRFSFNYEIRKKLKGLFKSLYPKNIFLIDGTENLKIIIINAYKFIHRNKGIDLIILGIGTEYDPHIAYNTTGKSSLNSKMRVVNLHPKVLDVIARRLARQRTDPPGRKKPTKQSPNVIRLLRRSAPRNDVQGITLGIKDILECRKVLLIAYGKEKAKSIKLAFKGKVDTKRASASALQLHEDLNIVIDKEAGKYLRYN